MKTKLKFLLMAAVALMISMPAANAQKKEKKSKYEEVTFSVPVDCPNCQKKLESVLPFEAGVKDMKIDLEKQTIWFKYQTSKTDKEKLQKAIVAQGYTAEEICGCGHDHSKDNKDGHSHSHSH